MPPVADQERALVSRITPVLNFCAIRPERVTVRYEDDLQSYAIVIREGPLAIAQIAFACGALALAGDVTFTEPVNAERQKDIEHDLNRARLKLWADDRPDLPRFDPARMTLVTFLRELEAYLGLEPGSALEVSGDFITLRSSWRPAGFRVKGELIQAVSAALADFPSYRLGVLGGSA